MQKLNIANAPSRAKRLVQDKTIIYSTVRPNLRHYAILQNPDSDVVVSTGFVTLDLKKAFVGVIDPYFIYLLLTQNWVVNKMQSIAENSVSSYPSFLPSDIEKLSFDFPVYEIQVKIANTIKSIDSKSSLNRKVIATFEKMAKQLYDYWFVQFDFPDEQGRPYKSSGGKMVYNEVLKREIPEGWFNGNLSDIATITMGQSPIGKSINEEKIGIIFFQGSTDFGYVFPKIRQYTNSPIRYAMKGDILVSVRAPVGDINIANCNCCIGRGLAAINPNHGANMYVYNLIRSFGKLFSLRNSVGTTFGSITKDDLYSLSILVPSERTVNYYEKLCNPIFQQQLVLEDEINILTSLRDFLLPMLMNGQVKIN